MAELIKPWNDGGSLSATYDGSGDGSAVFSSDFYEGIDREQVVVFRDSGKTVVVERTVRQEGIRQPIGLNGGGIFRLANGGRFGVLKGNVEPPAPLLPYEDIEYVTFDGTKIFDTGQYGNEKTTINIKFKRTDTSSNVYLYGVSASPRLSAHLAQSGYWRYSEAAYPTFNTKNTNETVAEVTPTRTKVGLYSRSYTASAFTTKYTLPVGGYKPSSGIATPQFKGNIYYFTMSIDGVLVADWIPVRRLSDGLECFWDCVTRSFIEPL